MNYFDSWNYFSRLFLADARCALVGRGLPNRRNISAISARNKDSSEASAFAAESPGDLPVLIAVSKLMANVERATRKSRSATYISPMTDAVTFSKVACIGDMEPHDEQSSDKAMTRCITRMSVGSVNTSLTYMTQAEEHDLVRHQPCRCRQLATFFFTHIPWRAYTACIPSSQPS